MQVRVFTLLLAASGLCACDAMPDSATDGDHQDQSRPVPPVPDLQITFRKQLDSSLRNAFNVFDKLGAARARFEVDRPTLEKKFLAALGKGHQILAGLEGQDVVLLDVSTLIGSNAFAEGNKKTISIPLFLENSLFGLPTPDDIEGGIVDEDTLDELIGFNLANKELLPAINPIFTRVMLHEYGHHILDLNIDTQEILDNKAIALLAIEEQRLERDRTTLATLLGHSVTKKQIAQQTKLLAEIDSSPAIASAFAERRARLLSLLATDNPAEAEDFFDLEDSFETLFGRAAEIQIPQDLSALDVDDVRAALRDATKAANDSLDRIAERKAQTAGVEANVYADVLYGAYYELFADFFQALAQSEGFVNPFFEAFESGFFPNGTFPLNPPFDSDVNAAHFRNFDSSNPALEQIDTWDAPKDHFVYSPVRAFLGERMAGKKLSVADKNRLLTALLHAIEADLAIRLTTDDPEQFISDGFHGGTLVPEKISFLNKELIARLEDELDPDTGDTDAP